MKRLVIFNLLVFVCLTSTTTAFGQKGCELNIVGTWKASGPGEATALYYRFGPDGTVIVLSSSGTGKVSNLQEIGSATYVMDNPKTPKVIAFKAAKAVGLVAQGATSIEIAKFDDESFTSANPGANPTRWARVDLSRYFLVLAGRSGIFYDRSGPAFPMLIKMDGQQTQIDAVGIYSNKGNPAFGVVPADAYKEFMKEPGSASDVMFRIEINGSQYERALKIMRTWERRVREGDLLYADVALDNILLVKQVTETLNQCGEKIKMYKLDWSLNDHISDQNLPSRAPFLYFKELRRLNESLHVMDEKFHGYSHPKQEQAAQ